MKLAEMSIFTPSVKLAFAFILCLAAIAQKPDDHLKLCHKEFLRLYRVELTEKSPAGEHKVWSRWYLMDTRKPEDKAEIEETLTFYRLNNIKVQYHAIEGELPE